MRWKIAKLSSPARGLLLAVLLAQAEGIDRMTAGEWKEEAGIGNDRDWKIALRQLAERGMAELEKRGRLYVVNAFALNGSVIAKSVSQSVDVGMSLLTDRCPTDAKAGDENDWKQDWSDLEEEFRPNELKRGNSSNGLNTPGRTPGNSSNGLNWDENSSNGLNRVVEIGQMNQIGNRPNELNSSNGLKSRCIKVDLLDDSGELARANSPAQVRRRAQVAVVQEVWHELFPTQNPLVTENAKWFLSHSEQSAEAVYDLLEYAKSRGIESPLGYARATAVNKEKERTGQAPISTAFLPGPVSTPEPVSDPVEQDRVDRAAVQQRVKNWKRFHPHEPVPADLYE